MWEAAGQASTIISLLLWMGLAVPAAVEVLCQDPVFAKTPEGEATCSLVTSDLCPCHPYQRFQQGPCAPPRRPWPQGTLPPSSPPTPPVALLTVVPSNERVSILVLELPIHVLLHTHQPPWPCSNVRSATQCSPPSTSINRTPPASTTQYQHQHCSISINRTALIQLHVPGHQHFISAETTVQHPPSLCTRPTCLHYRKKPSACHHHHPL